MSGIIATFTSLVGSQFHVLRDERGDLSCGCPGYKYSDEPRTCKHVRAVLTARTEEVLRLWNGGKGLPSVADALLGTVDSVGDTLVDGLVRASTENAG
jgi:hypothetical protein